MSGDLRNSQVVTCSTSVSIGPLLDILYLVKNLTGLSRERDDILTELL